MTFLVDAYTEEDAPTAAGGTERRVVLKLHPALTPVKVAVLPLSRNERLVPLAREVYDKVRRPGAIRGLVQYDDAQGIGRRYRRQDEVGTPLCVTVDFDSLEDSAVTIRERDSMAQVRVPIDELVGELGRRLGFVDSRRYGEPCASFTLPTCTSASKTTARPIPKRDSRRGSVIS